MKVFPCEAFGLKTADDCKRLDMGKLSGACRVQEHVRWWHSSSAAPCHVPHGLPDWTKSKGSAQNNLLWAIIAYLHLNSLTGCCAGQACKDNADADSTCHVQGMLLQETFFAFFQGTGANVCLLTCTCLSGRCWWPAVPVPWCVI